jgi:hypothetical protein
MDEVELNATTLALMLSNTKVPIEQRVALAQKQLALREEVINSLKMFLERNTSISAKVTGKDGKAGKANKRNV